MAEAPANRFVTTIEDSRRWRHVVRRAGDIIISTPPKSGTTLMQGIVTSLLWPAGDAPGTRGELSPWIDMRMTPIDELVEKVDAMEHQRYFKTHSPGDCIPFDKSCRYIVVYRDGRDTLLSWGNHRSKMRPQIVHAINNEAAKVGVKPLPTSWDDDYDALFDEWEQICSPVRHLGSWWGRRHQPNLLFVHYADLRDDLDGEMRRVAEFLDLEIDERHWARAVQRCQLADMRAQAHSTGGLDFAFDGGADAFFNQGVNGRWTDLLTAEQIDRYLALVSTGLSPDAAVWLEDGSRAVGARPNEIGDAPPDTVATGGSHPFAGRLANQQVNSLHAISERRVAQARDQGLFDGLELHGKPIPDIDRQRKPGWWADQFVAKQRHKVRALQLEDDIRQAMPALWRLPSSSAVTAEVARLNATITEYNRVTSLQPMAILDVADTVATWGRLTDR